MTDIDIIEVFCEGSSGTAHARRILRRYARREADPPQWWPMPHADALAQESVPTLVAPATWPRVGTQFTMRCRDCRLHIKRTLDLDYDRDYPPLSTVLESLREAGHTAVSARGLDRVVAWT